MYQFIVFVICYIYIDPNHLILLKAKGLNLPSSPKYLLSLKTLWKVGTWILGTWKHASTQKDWLNIIYSSEWYRLNCWQIWEWMRFHRLSQWAMSEVFGELAHIYYTSCVRLSTPMHLKANLPGVHCKGPKGPKRTLWLVLLVVLVLGLIRNARTKEVNDSSTLLDTVTVVSWNATLAAVLIPIEDTVSLYLTLDFHFWGQGYIF